VRIFGYAPGTVPPLGHRGAVAVVIDTEVAAANAMLSGGGEEGRLLRLPTKEVLRLPHVTVASLSVSISEPPGGILPG